MIKAERTARVAWQGGLAQGSGRVTMQTGALGEFGVSWPSRVEDPQGRTSPEELIAAAHASCFAMAMSAELENAGYTPDRLEVEARALIDDTGEGLSIKSMHLDVRGAAGGADAAGFQRAAEAAGQGCPVSKALSGRVQITVESHFEG
jgi:osmotically inducible protein OsmC